ncbi:unnamed protein product, partial [Ectocarpus sp. 12 AP-2014]
CGERWRRENDRRRCTGCVPPVNPFGLSNLRSSSVSVTPALDDGGAHGDTHAASSTVSHTGTTPTADAPGHERDENNADLHEMETGLGDEYEDPRADDDGEPPQASNRRDSGVAPDGLAALRDRVEAQLRVDQNFPDVDPNSDGGEDTGWGGGPVSSDVYDGGEDQYGGVESNSEQHQQHLEPPIESDSGSGAEAMRRLDNLHTHAPSYAGSSTLEGGPENLKHNPNAEGSDFYPFVTKEQQLIWIWQHTHQISRKALGGLLDILLLEDEGNGFDVRGLEGVDAEHFNNRMRQYLPLLRVLERNVPSTQESKSSSVVYDVPVNLLLARDMKLVSETALSETYPAGKILRGEEAAANSLTSDHVNCIPTKLV